MPRRGAAAASGVIYPCDSAKRPANAASCPAAFRQDVEIAARQGSSSSQLLGLSEPLHCPR
eukprot:7744119-Alexandrium_andersonii.AAC.1